MSRSLLVLTAGLMIMLPGLVLAAATPSQKCEAALEKAAGSFARCRLDAEAAFTLKGNAAKRAEALQKCAGTLNRKYYSALAKFGTACPVKEPVATFEDVLTQCADSVATAAGGSGTPVPTPTPGAADCEGSALTTTLITLPGSDLDTGFSGIAFNQSTLYDTTTATNLDCDLASNFCSVDGEVLVGTNLGGPLPLSSGGVPDCVINTFREAVTGTYNCATGCSEAQVKLTSFVYLSQKAEKPCPLCVGDTTPNDGVKGGTCDNDARAAGQPCDINGISPSFGATSNDCLPKGSSVGELSIDLTPLTTGTVTATASRNCLNPDFAPGSCFCAGQIQANSCTDMVCAPSGICENGPLSGRCSNQTFRACTPGTGTNDCESVYPGSGTCEGFLIPCFRTTITRTGQCGTDEGVLVSTFCIPATRAAAINTVAGLPGPGALQQPVRRVRVPR